MITKNNEILSDEDIRNIHNVLLNDKAQNVASIAKELGITPAALYYRFDALNLQAPDEVRIKKRNEEIVEDASNGASINKLREKYGLSKPSIYAILRKAKNGKEIPDTSK